MLRSGVSTTDAGFALATQGLGSAVVLNAIFLLALIVSLPLYGFQVAYLTVAIIGVLLMAFLAGLVVLFTKGDERAGEAGAGHRRQAAVPRARDAAAAVRPAGQPGSRSFSTDRRQLGRVRLVRQRQLALRHGLAVRVRGRLRPMGQPGGTGHRLRGAPTSPPPSPSPRGSRRGRSHREQHPGRASAPRGRSPSGASSAGGWSTSGCRSRSGERPTCPSRCTPRPTTRPGWPPAGPFGVPAGNGSSTFRT